MAQVNSTLTLGSLFDGSGGFPLGGLLSGITPVWASEIEPFPIRVTTKRLPFMKHYGDVSKMHGDKIEPVDIITFGSPCQDMSVAGKRAGLDGSRSNLFYQAIRIVKEMRCATNGKYPRYIVWENVLGAFSSNKGQDFRSVIKEICSVKDAEPTIPKPPKAKWTYAGSVMGDDYSVAWRVFDAQFWGVPQRRRRIFLVADFAGGSAKQILFESEGLSGYSTKSIYPWQGVARGFASCTGKTGICLNDQGGNRMDITEDITSTLRAEAHHSPCVMESAGFCTEHSAKSRSIGYEEERSPTIRTGVVPATIALFENHSQDTRFTGPLNTAPTVLSTYGTGGNNQPFIVDTPKTYGICSDKSNSMLSSNPYSGIYEAKTSRTLDANAANPSCNQGGIAIVDAAPSCNAAEKEQAYVLQGSMIGRDEKNGPQGDGINENVSFTPNTIDRHAVYAMTTGCFTQVSENTCPTLTARDYKDATVVNDVRYSVRRLTPTECARLQGFPDWWCADLETEEPTEQELKFWEDVWDTHTKIIAPERKAKTKQQIHRWLRSPHSDSAEYKMWGNGVALPCVCFVLSGIVWANKNEETE